MTKPRRRPQAAKGRPNKVYKKTRRPAEQKNPKFNRKRDS